MFGFLEFQEYLENLLVHRVGLVTKKAVKRGLKDHILKKAITNT